MDNGKYVVIGSVYGKATRTYPPNGTYTLLDGTTRSNYWAGAVKLCQDLNMTLVTNDEILYLYERKGQYGIPTTGWYWTSTISGPESPGYVCEYHQDVYDVGVFNLEETVLYHDHKYDVGDDNGVICIGG